MVQVTITLSTPIAVWLTGAPLALRTFPPSGSELGLAGPKRRSCILPDRPALGN